MRRQDGGEANGVGGISHLLLRKKSRYQNRKSNLKTDAVKW